MRSLVLLCAALLAAVLSFPAASALTVHLVPHTHDDVGWQVTVDQYYIQEVQYIITTVIEQLLVNPERRFIYVEQAYFQRWWREQNDEVKQQVRTLVANKQLEFINGGWSAHHTAAHDTAHRTRDQLCTGPSPLVCHCPLPAAGACTTRRRLTTST